MNQNHEFLQKLIDLGLYTPSNFTAMGIENFIKGFGDAFKDKRSSSATATANEESDPLP